MLFMILTFSFLRLHYTVGQEHEGYETPGIQQGATD